MKIVLLGPAHPYRGGIAALNQRLAVQLTRGGHEVIVFNFSLQYPFFLFPGKTQYTSDPAPEGIDIRRKVNSISPFNWWKVGRELRSMNPDLLLVRYWIPFMGPSLGTICRLVRGNRHTRVICIADNIVPHERRIGDALFTRYFVGGIDGFVAMSREVICDLERFAGHAAKTFAPHPVYDHYGRIIAREEALQHLGLDTNYRYLLFFGFIRKYKGLDLLLRAMADDRIREKPIKLIVAGEFYENERQYSDIIAQYHLEKQLVMHTKYIPDADINCYFCAADMVVQPYKSATQSGVTQVGYHFNKPMLVTRVGGLGEIVRDRESGYVVAPESESIADAIIDFYDCHREAAFVKETISMKQQFTWTNLVGKIMQVYDEIAGIPRLVR